MRSNLVHTKTGCGAQLVNHDIELSQSSLLRKELHVCVTNSCVLCVVYVLSSDIVFVSQCVHIWSFDILSGFGKGTRIYACLDIIRRNGRL